MLFVYFVYMLVKVKNVMFVDGDVFELLVWVIGEE